MNLLRVLAVLEAGVNSTQASWFFYDNEFMEKIVSFVRSHFIQNFEFSDFSSLIGREAILPLPFPLSI